MLKLIDLIELAGVELKNFKIHFATISPNDPLTPLEAFFAGEFKQWQERQSRKNFECSHILSLIQIHPGEDQWIFAGAYKVNDVKPAGNEYKPRNGEKNTNWLYATDEVKGLDHLTGKAIVQFKKDFRQPYVCKTEYADELFVTELRNQRMTIGDFPGYKSVLLSYRMLQTIIRESNPSWRTALSNIGGVYLITDTSNGKLYVGSAYGAEGIWQRWTDYTQNGHGGNKEIVKLLSEKGNPHKEHFQFSLLEVCDIDSDSEDVIKRENHWKTVLKTREFGLNN
jgi:hypothetical protein